MDHERFASFLLNYEDKKIKSIACDVYKLMTQTPFCELIHFKDAGHQIRLDFQISTLLSSVPIDFMINTISEPSWFIDNAGHYSEEDKVFNSGFDLVNDALNHLKLMIAKDIEQLNKIPARYDR